MECVTKIIMTDRLKQCINCKELAYDKEKENFKCLEGMSTIYHKENCPYYEDIYTKFYEEHINREDLKDFKGLDEYDFHILVKPVADMILYNWGLKLVGEGDDYNLIVFNEDWFKGKLIKTLITNRMV